MKKLILIFAIFMLSSPLFAQEEETFIKDTLLTGLDQLEDLMLGMERSIDQLRGDVFISQQVIHDMESIQDAQSMFLIQLRSELNDREKLDRARSQYIVLMQQRQTKYRIALAVGVPAGVILGVVGGVLIYKLIK